MGKINKKYAEVARGGAILKSSRKVNPKKGSKRGARVRMARASGDPIAPEHIELYKAEYSRIFDKVLAHCGCDEKTAFTNEQADRVNKLLGRCERIIRARYPTVRIVKWMPYMKLRQLMRRMGAPILITEEAHSGNLAYIIMDVEQGMI